MQQINETAKRKSVQKRRGRMMISFSDEQKSYLNDTAFPELWALKNKAFERMELGTWGVAANG